ncbi:hypothetical protein ACLM45_04585 [Synechococcus sp. A10-1-5-9]|uniref:hypothetical protein n=1 Tax=Synechococcus sp. A10-1-5-9 TaxID=3392295 RepID=UPI0039E86004
MGQATAHALKLSGLLHRAQSTDRHVVTERVIVVMDSADQLIIETKAFHEAPPLEATVLMQHILSINSDVI